MEIFTSVLSSLATELGKQPLVQGAILSIVISQVQKLLVKADKLPDSPAIDKIVGQVVVGLSVLITVGNAYLNHTLESLPMQDAVNVLQVWIGAFATHNAGKAVKGK